MQLLSSLLPGFREVRAPLVSGYLWLVLVWLVLEQNDAVPDRADSDLYKNLFDLGDAVGPVGLAVAASVAAYVSGSLIGQVLRWTWRFLETKYRGRGIAPRAGYVSGSFAPEFLQDLLRTGHRPTDCRRADKTELITRGLKELAARETEPAFNKLWEAAQRLLRELNASKPAAQKAFAISVFGTDGSEVSIGSRDRVKIPRFSADRNIFNERGVILSRLMEVSAFSGSKIDRLHAESEFRFAIAWPLLALIITFAAVTGDIAWLGLTAVPILLTLHGLGLHRDASLELVDALRSQPSSDALFALTPAYSRYREDAAALEKALEDAYFPA